MGLLVTEAAAQEDAAIRWDGEAGYACLSEEDGARIHGGYLGTEISYVPGPFIELRGGYALARHDSKGRAFTTHMPSVGARYLLDVFTYVPWFEVSPTYIYSQEVEGYTGVSIAMGVGVDWLMSPETTAGVSLKAHTLLDDGRFPGYLTIGLRLGRRWVLGDPFAP